MSLLSWGIFWLSAASFFGLQHLFGISAAMSALMTGVILVLLALLAGDRPVIRRV